MEILSGSPSPPKRRSKRKKSNTTKEKRKRIRKRKISKEAKNLTPPLELRITTENTNTNLLNPNCSCLDVHEHFWNDKSDKTFKEQSLLSRSTEQSNRFGKSLLSRSKEILQSLTAIERKRNRSITDQLK